jgi:hypothetical protein
MGRIISAAATLPTGDRVLNNPITLSLDSTGDTDTNDPYTVTVANGLETNSQYTIVHGFNVSSALDVEWIDNNNEYLTPAKVTKSDNNTIVVDFGEALTGTHTLTIGQIG